MRRAATLAAACAGLAVALHPACAQQGKAAKAEPPKIDAPEPAPPPYEPQLLRLSELMGALAYLRDLCREDDGEPWRSRMKALIEAEASTPARRERLAGAYNKGFRGYEITYRVCTANANLIISRSIDEAARLAHDISSRYGGS